MTRKSQPESYASHSFALFVMIGACSWFSGCSVFSPKKGSLTDYEQARRGIENPIGMDESAEGVYRPEGTSAERTGASMDFLQRMGLRAKRRKDIELARKNYAQGDENFEAAKTLTGRERQEMFRTAAEQYDLAAKNWQSSGLEQDAMMMSAESRFFAEDFYQAEQLYAKLVKEYPRNPYLDHVDTRRFEIADYWLKVDGVKHVPFLFVNFSDEKLPLNDTGGHGKRVLEKMRLDNPTGKVSDDATMRLAMEQFEKNKFEDAADTFADLRMTYPDSEHQFNAQFLELQSLLESYQGAQYSSIPLTEAQKRVKQIVKQFPQEASSREQDLQQAYAKIRFLMAERVWQQAKYRRDRSENGSAKFHYNRILEEYPDTPFAEEARESLEKLTDAPDDPPQRFKSLVWLFGSTTDDRPWRESADVPTN